jgi:hypothetical protein
MRGAFVTMALRLPNPTSLSGARPYSSGSGTAWPRQAVKGAAIISILLLDGLERPQRVETSHWAAAAIVTRKRRRRLAFRPIAGVYPGTFVIRERWCIAKRASQNEFLFRHRRECDVLRLPLPRRQRILQKVLIFVPQAGGETAAKSVL